MRASGAITRSVPRRMVRPPKDLCSEWTPTSVMDFSVSSGDAGTGGTRVSIYLSRHTIGAMWARGVRQERDTCDTARWQCREMQSGRGPHYTGPQPPRCLNSQTRQMRWRIEAGKLLLGTVRQGTTAKSLPLIIL
jgi:hypothetical protein